MGVLSHLEPQNLFAYFETICGIPHGSGNTGAIVDYCVRFAEERGLTWYRDKADNLLIRKPASPGYEQAETIILQGHTDMVCEKDPGVDFDFQKDGIRLVVEGDTLRADGTTLGGDNGIAVAMCLAILDSRDLPHPPLEVLLTADEEIGMLGAFAFDGSQLTGHRLINLDSEYEGVLMCSCAGGANAYSKLPVRRKELALTQVELEISGLTSGHSGVEIDKGRGNSNILMGRMLQGLMHKAPFQLIHLEGGSRETAIASKTTAVLGVNGDASALLAEAGRWAEILKKEYAATEPSMTVSAKAGPAANAAALTAADTEKVLKVLLALPDSVQAMSADMPGLVQTSLNFGILRLDEGELFLANTVRSSMTTQKEWILERVAAIVTLAGGTTEFSGSYPGWSYNPSSVVKDTILQVYQDLFGKEATVEAVHAGIECGLFADSIPDLDCVSIGPEMADVHTPREHLSISSSARTYQLLCEVLKRSR
ncbi:aminoacyl-histidine dipeptidase [Oscillospiraceae bacterium 38-13]